MSPDYLIIEQFIADALQARVLQAAFEMGVIDVLASADDVSVSDVLDGRECDEAGGQFLLQMLVKAGVLNLNPSAVQLTETFRRALHFRDLLTTKLRFAELVAEDYFTKLPMLLRSSKDFMTSARLFELFDYSRCLDVTTENCMQASRWMQLTTMLTRYEAPVCHEFYPFGQHRHMLDVGGNSGEFALQICSRQPQLKATVFDLPVVCQVGQRHVAGYPQSGQVNFHAGNLMAESLPEGCDLITWKSVLHDWPDEHIPSLLQKSFDVLPEGGSILIFERQAPDFSIERTSYGQLPVMLFFRHYRSPVRYVAWLQDVGFSDVNVQHISLEVPFLLITAVR